MHLKAYHLGEKFKMKGLFKLKGFTLQNRDPLVLKYENSKVFIFKYGVAVFMTKNEKQTEELIKRLTPHLEGEFSKSDQRTEELTIKTTTKTEQVKGTTVYCHKADEHFQILLAVMLARSLILEFFEEQIGAQLDTLTNILHSFAKKGRTNLSTRQLLKVVGRAMQLRNLMVSQMALLDKPDFTWDDPYLDQWYPVLDDEYEISDRYEILVKKNDIIFTDVEFVLNYLESRKGLFLEAVIVFLILFEIGIVVVQFLTGNHS
ncbi:hypothetical protein COU74_00630 [Candidatus Peregrinibacteria bacterium CG10_big_fil_rev_8_21_14_0_10_36_19]|nr:MAG: hypothetical protein COU74_00630 [Candidatus Peregrinibacteria bacterium CG10_big_fil_rev_8_21_14_0_10_36_19]